MVTLHLRFAGLNLFVRQRDAYHVYVTDARGATSGHDKKALRRHTPYLIIEEGSMTEEGQPDRPFLGEWIHPGRLQRKFLDFKQLSGNVQITLAPESQQESPNEPYWLPHLSAVDLRVDGDVDRPKPLRLGPVAATFRVVRGVFCGGQEIQGVTWLGNHKGDEPSSLFGWTQLIYEADGDRVTLQHSTGRDWELHPPEPGRPIVAWVGNVAEADHAPESPERHSEEVIDHFRWLYQHLPMRPEPISGLAHPKIPAHLKIFRPGSTFCPDGQYP
ncbi:MAG TPA: hypothetical protein VHG52_12360 [Thermomicrobiales bacterium]|nr:hypothetical protein [Thermomicrobiales bacterium]